MPTSLPDVDHRLHDTLVALVRAHGPLDLRTLTRRVRLLAADEDRTSNGSHPNPAG